MSSTQQRQPHPSLVYDNNQSSSSNNNHLYRSFRGGGYGGIPSGPNENMKQSFCAGCKRTGVTLLICDDCATPETGAKGVKQRYCAQCMIGKKVRVFWPLDEQWYVGVVQRYDPSTGEHLLRYPDGDEEWVRIGDNQNEASIGVSSEREVMQMNHSPSKHQEGAVAVTPAHGSNRSGQNVSPRSPSRQHPMDANDMIHFHPGSNQYPNRPQGYDSRKKESSYDRNYTLQKLRASQQEHLSAAMLKNVPQQQDYLSAAMAKNVPQQQDRPPPSPEHRPPPNLHSNNMLGPQPLSPNGETHSSNASANFSSFPPDVPQGPGPPQQQQSSSPKAMMSSMGGKQGYVPPHQPPRPQNDTPPHRNHPYSMHHGPPPPHMHYHPQGMHPGYPPPHNPNQNPYLCPRPYMYPPPPPHPPSMQMDDKDDDTTGGSGHSTGKRKSGPKTWTKEEDAILLDMVQNMRMPMKWSIVAQSMPDRTGKQCRERYVNHLNPRLKNSEWSPNEDATIFHLYNSVGSQWAKMSKMIPGRTDNGIKNRFHNLRRQLEREDDHRLRLSKPQDFPDEIHLDRLREFPDDLKGKSHSLWDMNKGLGIISAQSVIGAGVARNQGKFGPFRKLTQADGAELCVRCGLFVPSVHCGEEICERTRWCQSCTRIPPHLSGNMLRETLNLRKSQNATKLRVLILWSKKHKGLLDNDNDDVSNDNNKEKQHTPLLISENPSKQQNNHDDTSTAIITDEQDVSPSLTNNEASSETNVKTEEEPSSNSMEEKETEQSSSNTNS